MQNNINFETFQCAENDKKIFKDRLEWELKFTPTTDQEKIICPFIKTVMDCFSKSDFIPVDVYAKVFLFLDKTYKGHADYLRTNISFHQGVSENKLLLDQAISNVNDDNFKKLLNETKLTHQSIQAFIKSIDYYILDNSDRDNLKNTQDETIEKLSTSKFLPVSLAEEILSKYKLKHTFNNRKTVFGKTYNLSQSKTQQNASSFTNQSFVSNSKNQSVVRNSKNQQSTNISLFLNDQDDNNEFQNYSKNQSSISNRKGQSNSNDYKHQQNQSVVRNSKNQQSTETSLFLNDQNENNEFQNYRNNFSKDAAKQQKIEKDIIIDPIKQDIIIEEIQKYIKNPTEKPATPQKSAMYDLFSKIGVETLKKIIKPENNVEKELAVTFLDKLCHFINKFIRSISDQYFGYTFSKLEAKEALMDLLNVGLVLSKNERFHEVCNSYTEKLRDEKKQMNVDGGLQYQQGQ